MKYKSFLTVSLLGLVFSLFSGCQSSNNLRVPGESAIITKNIASEYFTIAEGYYELKKYDKAAEYYGYAMKNKNLRLSAYYKMARCYAIAKNYDKAIKCYNDLLKLDPDNKDLQVSIAYINGMSGKTDEALKNYETLYEKYPNDASVLENYINLLIYLKKAEDAVKYFAEFGEKFPDSANLKALSEKVTALKEKEVVPEPENNIIPPAEQPLP